MSKLVLKAVASCFVALNYYENGSRLARPGTRRACIAQENILKINKKNKDTKIGIEKVE
jgi:hypothetical protein